MMMVQIFKHRALLSAVVAGVLCATISIAFAQNVRVFETSAGPVRTEVLAQGLENPWAIAFLPDGRLLVSERPGRLRIVEMNGKIGDPIAGLPNMVAQRQGGLLDVAVAPDFADTGRIYLTFSESGRDAGVGRGAGTAVMSAVLNIEGMSGTLSAQKVIFRMNNFTDSGVHYGSRIVIADDGNLWVTLGERGEMDRAQDPFDLAGGVVRIRPDGSIPEDNPFADGAEGDPAFWSIGHRNPQGATLGADGSLWTVEHGAMGGDEINKPQAGRNYGWPVITYGINYNGQKIGIGTAAAGYEQPVYYWDPSIAPSGLDFYDGDLFPAWKGDLLVGSLKFKLLVRLEMDGDTVVGEERLFEGAFGRIRDVRVGPDGAIYLATDEPDGQIIIVEPAQ